MGTELAEKFTEDPFAPEPHTTTRSLGSCTASEFAALLHPAPNWGVVTVCKKLQKPKKDGSDWMPENVLPENLKKYLDDIRNPTDWYMTPNEFRFSRCCDGLTSLRACWVDIDGEPSLENVKRRLDGLPEPSMIVFTGRGYHVYWLLNSVQKFELARWNHVQQTICDHVGGDPIAKDAARVLRLPQTQNTKNGKWCRVIEGTAHYYDFDELELQIIDVDYDESAELYSIAIERVERGIVTPVSKRSGKLGEAMLWEGRLRELRALAKHRWNNDIEPGRRDAWMFIASNAMSWLAPAEAMGREIISLANRVCPAWSQSEVNERMHAINKRVQMAARGEQIEWQGKIIDPRYRFRTDTIIDWLKIDEQEMRELGFRHMVTSDILKEHDRDRKERDRRSQGMLPRGEYLKQCASDTDEKRVRARALRAAGHSVIEIAAIMEAGVSSVYWWLKG